MAGDSQTGSLLEELSCEIDLAVLLGDILDEPTLGEDGGDFEHFASALAVSGSDQGSMDVQEAVVLIELVSSECQVVLDASNDPNNLGSWPQVGDGPQSFSVDLLPSKWVLLVVTSAENVNFLELVPVQLQLHRLPLSQGLYDFSRESERIPDFSFFHLLPIGHSFLDHHLQGHCIGPIDQLDEQQSVISL